MMSIDSSSVRMHLPLLIQDPDDGIHTLVVDGSVENIDSGRKVTFLDVGEQLFVQRPFWFVIQMCRFCIHLGILGSGKVLCVQGYRL